MTVQQRRILSQVLRAPDHCIVEGRVEVCDDGSVRTLITAIDWTLINSFWRAVISKIEADGSEEGYD
jgi:hypothetical protein